MVVEDHQARQRGQQPPVRRVGPGQPVEVGVLLVVLELLPRRLAGVAAGLDELLHLRGGLVGVHLVAEEQHEVGPPLVVGSALAAGHPQRVAAHRVDAVGLVALRVVGDARAAGPERHPQRLARPHRGDHARGVVRPGVRPHRRTVHLHRVGLDAARLEPGHLHQRVVVAVGGEGPGLPGAAGGPYDDPGGVTGLHPDRGGGRVDVPEQRTEDEWWLSHRDCCTPLRRAAHTYRHERPRRGPPGMARRRQRRRRRRGGGVLHRGRRDRRAPRHRARPRPGARLAHPLGHPAGAAGAAGGGRRPVRGPRGGPVDHRRSTPGAPLEPTETWCVFTVTDGKVASIARFESPADIPAPANG